MIRNIYIAIAQYIAWLMLLPFLLWSRLPLPEYSTFTAPSQLLSLIPGFLGILLRRVWYRATLHACGTNLTVDWLGVIRARNSKVGNRCTFGVANWLGWVCVGDDVMTGSHVVFISGGHQHSFEDLSRPMREQYGEKRQVIIGNDVWVGTKAVIMADVSSGTVIGAGSVVTRQHDQNCIIAGIPARVIRRRGTGGK